MLAAQRRLHGAWPSALAAPADRAPLVTPRFSVESALTDESVAARLNPYLELTRGRDAHRLAPTLQAAPVRLAIGGLVERPLVLDAGDLRRLAPPEERVYRQRCVEGWAAVVPWLGIPLASVLRAARPRPDARYVRFVSAPPQPLLAADVVADLLVAYEEALTLPEAMNELTFLATGIYGHDLPLQHGAPLRLVVPWKYAHKSVKALARIELTATRPATTWSALHADAVDFTANVDPNVPHARWPQHSEKLLGTGEIRPTQPFNGYGEWVAHLYA